MLQAEVARSSSGEAASNMGATTGILPSNVEWNPVLELAEQGVAAVEKTPTIAEIEKRHKAEMDALTLHFESEKQMNQECVVCLDDIKCMTPPVHYSVFQQESNPQADSQLNRIMYHEHSRQA